MAPGKDAQSMAVAIAAIRIVVRMASLSAFKESTGKWEQMVKRPPLLFS